MKLLEKDLGKALRTQDVAEYLGVDIKTVRKYYRELGGIRLGRHYRFFEKEIFNAIQKKTAMDRPSEERGNEAEQGRTRANKVEQAQTGPNEVEQVC